MSLKLTAQELRVLHALAQGLDRCEAGAAFGITENTIKTHTERARWKLRARNTTHAIALCYERGLFDGTLPNGGQR